MAASTTSPAGIGQSSVWCSPIPKKSTPVCSAGTASSTTRRIVSAWESGVPDGSYARSPNVSSPNSHGKSGPFDASGLTLKRCP
jgi:hypothetical protein